MNLREDIKEESLQSFISSLQSATRSLSENILENTENNVNKLLNDIKVHIDRKILALTESLSNPNDDIKMSYTIPIYIGIGKNKDTVGYIEIRGEDSVQKVLNKIYYLFDGDVKAYTYMSSWILKERHCGAYMIMHEITNLIPASAVFRPDLEWEAVEWESNYDPGKSKFKIGLYPYW